MVTVPRPLPGVTPSAASHVCAALLSLGRDNAVQRRGQWQQVSHRQRKVGWMYVCLTNRDRHVAWQGKWASRGRLPCFPSWLISVCRLLRLLHPVSAPPLPRRRLSPCHLLLCLSCAFAGAHFKRRPSCLSSRSFQLRSPHLNDSPPDKRHGFFQDHICWLLVSGHLSPRYDRSVPRFCPRLSGKCNITFQGNNPPF